MSLAVRSRWDRTCYNTPRLHANCKPMIDRVVFIRYIEETEPPWDQGDVPWIVRMLVRWGMTILAFIVAKWFVNGVWDGTPIFLHGTDGYLVAPAIFVVVRAIFRPILIFLTCPLQIITLGLFILVVNALVVVIWSGHVRKIRIRSEEHTSELQSRGHLVCRLLLEKKK